MLALIHNEVSKNKGIYECITSANYVWQVLILESSHIDSVQSKWCPVDEACGWFHAQAFQKECHCICYQWVQQQELKCKIKG